MSIISGMGQASATQKAGKAQAQAAKSAAHTMLQMYYQQRADLAPWREAGGWSLNELRNMLTMGPGEFEESPGYQFRLAEGTKALERGAAARGGLLSGRQQKALTRYGQELGSQEYENFLSRYYQRLAPYQSIAGLTATPTTASAGYGMQTGRDIGQTLMAGGQARASQYINQANALTGMMGGMQQNPWNYLSMFGGMFGGG